ncbi:ABC transporter permease [Microbacterium luticocti]|uniref:ABC transporter permease n=1 Tax=Microbacterium luticocti TaxID=451764 RepID=UPI000405D563|nr:ABC transporter permease [Microbacterium luticocti]
MFEHDAEVPSVWRFMSPRLIGAVYIWILLIIAFSLWMPALFLRASTPQTILNQSTVTAIVAMSVILPLAVGVFDLSIGAVVGLSAVVSAWLLGNTDLPVGLVILITLFAGAALGAVNAFIVLGMKIDSFIGTLATGSIFAALTVAISDNKIMTSGITGAFSQLSTARIFGLQLPVLYMLVLMVMLGIFLEKMRVGRLMYGVGFNAEASRLAGVNVTALRASALIASSLIGAFAGLVLLGRIQAADPMGGASYMIPAYSAAFLGATQFRRGRFNPWGTVVAVLLLQTGSYGLLLSGIGQWAPQVFQGVVLIAAVGVTVTQRRVSTTKRHRPRGGDEDRRDRGAVAHAPSPGERSSHTEKEAVK